MAQASDVRVHDVMPVQTRVSWGALFAGLFVALTVYVLLGVLGMALGFSFADRMENDTTATVAGVWAVATLLAALFCGGCVATRCTAGETKGEAIMYGVILWGVMFTLIVWMSGNVLRAGFSGTLQTASIVTGSRGVPANWEQAARDAGVSQEQIERVRRSMPTVDEVRDVSKEAAWWSFAGLIASLGAAIGGAYAGAGPTPLGGMIVRRTTVHAAGHGV